MPILEPIFDFRAERKRSRTEPSWKTFSSSYGSSQLGSNSSLIGTRFYFTVCFYSSEIQRKIFQTIDNIFKFLLVY